MESVYDILKMLMSFLRRTAESIVNFRTWTMNQLECFVTAQASSNKLVKPIPLPGKMAAVKKLGQKKFSFHKCNDLDKAMFCTSHCIHSPSSLARKTFPR